MSINDELGKRIKSNYESITKYRLTRRMPVIVRIDGRAFHTYTRGFRKPFDPVLMEAMQYTMKYLCEEVQGCTVAYTQSDEISLLLVDYKDLSSQAWFDNEVQKISSITASMATVYFNRAFNVLANNFFREDEKTGYTARENKLSEELGRSVEEWTAEDHKLFYERNQEFCDMCGRYDRATGFAMFDSRCFNIPKEEVTNYFYWRQLDATRNSIEMVGRSQFSDKELYKKSCNAIQDMLMTKGINWNNFSVPEKRGTCCIHTGDGWKIDKDIPIFKGEGRGYIERFVNVE